MGTGAFARPASAASAILITREQPATSLHSEFMKPARLLVFQAPRNPTEREREILTLLAEGPTFKQAAGHLGLKHRTITRALEEMRHRSTTPTNEALMALATRQQWIDVIIDIPEETFPPLSC